MALSPVSPASLATPATAPSTPPVDEKPRAAKRTPRRENASSLKHPDGPFTLFSAPSESITLPTRRQFVRQNLLHNAWPSYERGFTRYFKTLKDNPAFGLSVGAMTLGLGALFTAFRRHHRVIETAFLLGAIGYPLMALARHGPQMFAAYDALADERDRAKADDQFKTAMDKLVFKVGHVYLKPLGLTALVVYPLMNFRRVALGNAKRLIAFTMRHVSSAPVQAGGQRLLSRLTQWQAIPWVIHQDRWANTLAAWGDRVVARLTS